MGNPFTRRNILVLGAGLAATALARRQMPSSRRLTSCSTS
jgi:hypothetical protein